MADTAVASLEAIRRGLETGAYVEIPDVPIFDEHEEADGREYIPDGRGGSVKNPDFGKVIRRFGRRELEEICAVYNQRAAQSGDLAPIGPGHTIPGNVPETMQPPIWGFGAPKMRVDTFGPGKKLGILTSLYARAEHEADVRREFPRRSIELFYKDKLIDWIALLRRSPQRDLGMLAYSRDAQELARKRFCPWTLQPTIINASKRQLAATFSHDGKLRYAMEQDDMPANASDPTKDPNVATPPDLPDPDELQGPEKDTADKFMRHYRKNDKLLRFMHSRYGAEAGVDDMAPQPPPGAAPGGPAMPSATNGAPPMQDDKARMQRDSEAIRFQRIESQLAAAELRYQRAESERLCADLEALGYDLDRASETETMARMNEADRVKRVDYIKRFHRRDESGLNPVRHQLLHGTPSTTGALPDQGNEAFDGLSRDRFEKVGRYMREHPGMQWEDAKSKCPA